MIIRIVEDLNARPGLKSALYRDTNRYKNTNWVLSLFKNKKRIVIEFLKLYL